jgi:NAD(P)-dependent dehydrogenase (short-subunit alcohol dehydrogenase family)
VPHYAILDLFFMNEQRLRPIQERAEKAIQTITSATPSPQNPGKITFLHLDLNDLATVKAAAEAFKAAERRLDVLVHNAGMSPFAIEPFAKTVQGIEAMVGMHCVAPLVLTHHLLPSLRAATAQPISGPARVLWAGSISAEFSSPENGIDFSHLETGFEDRTTNYGVSKLGNWALAKEAARRFGNDGIVSVAFNPGNVRAGTYEGLPAVTYFLMKTLVLSETKKGAYTEFFAALAPEVGEKKWNGSYIIPFGRLRDDDKSHRKDIVKALKPVEEDGLGYSARFWDWCVKKAGAFM